MRLKIEIDREEDGRWIAEIPGLPGVMVYGATREEAEIRLKALAHWVLAAESEGQQTQGGAIEFMA